MTILDRVSKGNALGKTAVMRERDKVYNVMQTLLISILPEAWLLPNAFQRTADCAGTS